VRKSGENEWKSGISRDRSSLDLDGLAEELVN
jgi:hypothetical protein